MPNYLVLKAKTLKYRSLLKETFIILLKLVRIYLIFIKYNVCIIECTSEIKLVIQGSGIQDI